MLQKDAIFVAISPWTPLAAVIEDVPWTIFYVRKDDGTHVSDHAHVRPTIRVATTSSSSRLFLEHLETLDPNRYLTPNSSAVEVRIQVVRPITLDTVYVTLQKNLLDDVDDAQRRYGGGFDGPPVNGINDRGRSEVSKTKSTAGTSWSTSGQAQTRLARLVREAVGTPRIIHEGDTLALPLPSHPITHIPPPPTIISACEPVTQGMISSSTRIILVQTESMANKIRRRASPMAVVPHVPEDDGEDTSNEQFYSAAEDREDEVDPVADLFNGQSDTELCSLHDSEDLSDDSLEDMISLRAPELTRQSPGTGNVTPRPGGGRFPEIHTPGSLHSSYTIASLHDGRRPGKVCRAETILQRIPIAALHPKPEEEDDDHSFVFVDMNTLSKVGCFSGDWVRLETCKRPDTDRTTSLNFVSIEDFTADSPDWRAVRIFGLSKLALQKSSYTAGGKVTSKSRLSPASLTPAVYIPPLLLHNLGGPRFVKLSALPRTKSSTSNLPANPPLATEVTLRKVSTPVSTKKEVQSILSATLKEYFQLSFRILKTGDLIATKFDVELGRATFDIAQGAENSGDDIVTADLSSASSSRGSQNCIAWFAVDQVVQGSTDNASCQLCEEDSWGGIVMVDSSRIKMAQAGNTVQGIPESLANNVAIWLRLKKPPQGLPLLAAGLGCGGTKLEPYVLPLQKRLSDLVSTVTSPRALSLNLPPLAILLHSTQRQIGKSYVATCACAAVGVQTLTIPAYDALADGGSANGGGDVKTQFSLKARTERAFSCGTRFTALLITHLEMLTADRMVPALSEIMSESRVLIATTTELKKIPDGVRSLFTYEFEMTAPNEAEREGILYTACLQQALRLDPSVQLGAVALKTAALVAGDLVDIVHRASVARSRRLEKLAAAKGVSVSDLKYCGGPFVSNATVADFDVAIGHARSTFSDSIGAPKIPTVTWEDVGGLADQKSSILETISLPLNRPELFAKGMRKRSGMLFYGPPGTGKTLLAKAIATEFSLNFFSIKGPELLNMYIGESEANVRRVFQRARDARPCVVFFDELDSVAPKRGNQGDSGGVMDRIVSQLLAELDGMSSGGMSDDNNEDSGNGNAGGVFVIGATNRPDLLDPALLRPGRFDKMLYLGVSSTHKQQVTILKALTRKFTLDANVDLTRVASRLPLTFTGADLYALCSDAMLKAIAKKTKQVDVRVQEASRASCGEISTAYFFDHLATPDDTTVVVREDDFTAAQKEMVASVR